jgi:hypothetical protein
MVPHLNNSQYFYRTTVFTRRNNQIALADVYQPKNSTPLDEWLGIVISLADGSHTIQELIDYMGKQYSAPPPDLNETLHSVIERLQEGNLLKLSDSSVTLPYYLSEPIENLDLEKAKTKIEEDGYDMSQSGAD